MMFEEAQSFRKRKLTYFRNFWSYINIGIICCSWANIGIFIWRYRELSRIGDIFKQTNGYSFINLQLAVYIDSVFTYLLSFCCFFGTIKFVKFGRFNHRLMFFCKTLQHASKDLFSFACMFSFVFVAFLTLFYLLFVSKLSNCSSLLQTAEMLFEMILMKFDAHKLSDASAFLGPLSFSLFIFFAVFICMSMFITIINDSFRAAREDAKAKSNTDQHILSFMLHKFQRWIGMKTFVYNNFIKNIGLLLFLFLFIVRY